MVESKRITVCRTTLNIFKYSLIWPEESEEMDPNKWFYIRIVIFILITIPWILSVLMHLITTIKYERQLTLSEDIAFMTSFCGLYCMIFFFIRSQKKLACLLADLSNFDDFGIPPNFEIITKRLAFLSRVCFIYTIVGIFGYDYIKYTDRIECQRINQEKGYEENCGLLTPTWTPVPLVSFPSWHLVALYQLISSQILMKLGLMMSFLELEIAQHIIIRINHLNLMLIECFDDEHDENRRIQLNNCIKYHNSILEFAARLDDCFKNSMLSHLTITGTICGCLEYQFIKTNNKIGSVIHILGWMLALCVACLGGQNISNAGDSIAESIYKSKWYTANIALKKDVCLMLLRSQQGLFLRAGPFGFLGFPLFVSVVKMSYSILALLKQRN